MTPAIAAARKAGIPHQVLEYRHDPGAESYGLEAAEALGIDPATVFKTLVVADAAGRSWAVGLVPVDRQLDLKAMAAALGMRKVEMAQAADAERLTGYVVGGISPLGQRRRLAMVVDDAMLGLAAVHVSAGRRGLEIVLAPADLLALTGARAASIAR
ncbi:MAG: Cys-tRNA(Pro) deacylase [bacterium]|jgi:Cys-tRNA(Pro)/Cys-tRNA(Cys) deacylase|nr:Cys-tRNA(Pro) deacylase [Betaproteobacteria bacterium]